MIDPLVPNTIYRGVVVGTVTANQTFSVRLERSDRTVSCCWAAGIVSSLIGIRTHYIPPPDTRVLVLYGTDISLIVGSFPDYQTDRNRPDAHAVDPDSKWTDTRAIGQTSDPSRPIYGSHDPPVDLVEGELDLTNSLGVGLSLLRRMASLRAGDRASIECWTLDDMVRVISGRYRHH